MHQRTRRFPCNSTEAEVSFSKCFIKLIIIFLLNKNFFDQFLAREKSLHVGMLRVVSVGKQPLPNLQNFKIFSESHTRFFRFARPRDSAGENDGFHFAKPFQMSFREWSLMNSSSSLTFFNSDWVSSILWMSRRCFSLRPSL